MEQVTKDKLTVNVENAHKMASNWAATATGALFVVYLALPAEQQAALVAHLPVPAWVIPIITSVISIVARLWPQKSITPAVAAAKSDSPPEETQP